MPNITLKTCESVCAGHPDKICDQISDAILDACLAGDPTSRVAVECLIKDNNLIIAGEITTTASPEYTNIAKQVLNDIGYTKPEIDSFKIQILVSQQSPDIAQGVDTGGAGDQGMMYGYATDETVENIPLPLLLSHRICERLGELRKSDINCPFRPDGKAQVSIQYEDGKPVFADTIIISTQHIPEISTTDLEKYVFENVVKPVCGQWLKIEPVINPHMNRNQTNSTKIFINPTGRFEIGVPFGDCGLTGRKIVVDTYGGIGRVGGGAFSGKDPSKVDRSAAYMARHLAKKLVALKFGEEVEVRLAYAIGVARPVDVSVNIIRGDVARAPEASAYITNNFDLTPQGIIKTLDLRRPIYSKTAAYGHFGRGEFSWETIS